MICARHARWRNCSALTNLLHKNYYSRRSDNNTNTFKLVKTTKETFNDVESRALGADSNWELLTPNGFRFYLPGCVGPGWTDASTTQQQANPTLSNKYVQFNGENEFKESDQSSLSNVIPNTRRVIKCTAQDCPLLLRKSITELFPGCRDSSCSLTIITINQTTNLRRMRFDNELETERLAKNFILVASDLCSKLKMVGFWADFINPFSGKPHLGPQKQNNLYTTDVRFRCLGFKVNDKNNCKVISCDRNIKNFKGNLFTNAPANTDFFKEILNDYVIVKINNDK